MPDFELDQESVSRAASLSSRLMQDLRMVSEQGPPSEGRREVFSEQRYADQAEGAPIADVVDNVAQMATEFAMLRRWDSEVLCLKLDDGELIPISISESLGGSPWPYGSQHWFEFWEREFPLPFPRRFWRDILRRSGQDEEQVKVVNVREAEKGVGRNLSAFLSYRFAGMKRWTEWIQGVRNPLFGGPGASSSGAGTGSAGPPPPAVGPGGGLQVQGLLPHTGIADSRLASLFHQLGVFRQPQRHQSPVTSSPAVTSLPGDGPMLPRRTRDRAVFSIPPTYHPTLTRF